MRMKEYSLIMLMSILISFFTGCVPLVVGAAAGAGAFAFVKGEMQQNFDKGFDRVHRAALSGVKKLGLSVVSDKTESHKATVKVKFKTGEDAVIDIASLTEKATQVRIRVGIFGDELKSQMILEAIQKRL